MTFVGANNDARTEVEKLLNISTRGATGAYDAKTESYTLYACSQSAGTVRNQTAPMVQKSGLKSPGWGAR